MKVAQLRGVLNAVAEMHEKAGRSDEVAALRKLALALSPADKQSVIKMVEKLAR